MINTDPSRGGPFLAEKVACISDSKSLHGGWPDYVCFTKLDRQFRLVASSVIVSMSGNIVIEIYMVYKDATHGGIIYWGGGPQVYDPTIVGGVNTRVLPRVLDSR